MKPRLLEKLACPHCRASNWTVKAEAEVPGDVMEGSLVCGCARTYPIKDGVVFFEIDLGSDSASVWNEYVSKMDADTIHSDLERVRRNVESGLAAKSCLMARLLSRRPENYNAYLDIGCGGGSFSWMIHTVRPRMEFTLLDYSVSAVLLARRNTRSIGLDVDLVQGNALKLPFKDNIFDLSSTAGLLEHFGGDEQLKILEEQARISASNLCQVPIKTLGYKILHRLVEWKYGKWPFGFEEPLEKKKLIGLLRQSRWEPVASASQSLLTAVFLHVLKIRFSWFYRLFAWTENLLAYDTCVLSVPIRKTETK